MNTLSNQTIQLVGAMLLGLIIILFIGALAIMEIPIPDILDRLAYLLVGAVIGSTAVNGVRAKMNGRGSK